MNPETLNLKTQCTPSCTLHACVPAAAPSCDPGQRPGCDEAAGAGDGRHAFSSMLMHQQQESMVRQRMEEEQEEEDAQV